LVSEVTVVSKVIVATVYSNNGTKDATDRGCEFYLEEACWESPEVPHGVQDPEVARSLLAVPWVTSSGLPVVSKTSESNVWILKALGSSWKMKWGSAKMRYRQTWTGP
jgi:hypothetical protein